MLAVSARRFAWRNEPQLIKGIAEASNFDEAERLFSLSFIICGRHQNVTMNLEARHVDEDGIYAWSYAGHTSAGKLVKITIFND